jgi:hypothetical protein
MANRRGLKEWHKLNSTIDDDLRLIYPDMYLENAKLFDKIMAVGYLIHDLSHPESGLDWVVESKLNKILLENPNIAVISKLLVVRLRLPWNEVDTEWLVSEVEFNEHRDEYEVLEVFLKIRRKNTNEKAKWLKSEERQYFDEHRDEFIIVEKRYSVRWKWSEEEIANLLDESLVNKENVHEYISK